MYLFAPLFFLIFLSACSNQSSERTAFSISETKIGVLQSNNETTVLVMNSTTRVLEFQLECKAGYSSLVVSLQAQNGEAYSPWERIQSFNCPASGKANMVVNFDSVISAVAVSSGTIVSYPVIQGKIKITRDDAESKVVFVTFVAPTYDAAGSLLTLGGPGGFTNSSTTTLFSTAAFAAGTYLFPPSNMYVTDSNTCDVGSTWTAFASVLMPVTLNFLNQANTKYVRFLDAYGNVSPCMVTSTLNHDSISPTLTSVQINSGQAQTNTPNVSVALQSTSTDIDAMAVFDNVACTGTETWQNYSTAFNLTIPASGNFYVYVKLRDVAGNISTCQGSTIVYNTSPPRVPTSINLASGIAAISNLTTIQLEVGGLLNGDLAFVYANSACTGALLGAGTAAGTVATVPITLTTDGLTTFYASSQDPFSQVSGCSAVNATYTLDRVGPSVQSVTSILANNDYRTGSTVTVDVVYPESVFVTGTPQLELALYGTTVNANYVSGSGTNTLRFSFAVTASMLVDVLNYVSTNSLTLNGGTIIDAYGNNASLVLPATNSVNALGQTKTIRLNYSLLLSTVYGPAPGLYGTGDTLEFTTLWSGPGIATTPVLNLTFGASAGTANYQAARSDPTQGLFKFQTAALAAQADSNGIDLTSITTAASLRNIYSANADLTIPSSFSLLTGAILTGGPIRTHSLGSSIESHLLRVSEAAGVGAFDVILSAAALEDTVLEYKVIPGTATPGVDFVLNSGQLTIPAGQSSGTISFSIVNNAILDGTRTFAVNIESSSRSRTSSSAVFSKEVFILDDDKSAVTLVDYGVGRAHMCALFSDGLVRCSGENSSGQLGQGNTSSYSGWVTVFAAGSGVSKLKVGHDQTCVIIGAGGGSLSCWGANSNGQLGLGHSSQQNSPAISVSAGATVLDIFISKETNSAFFSCLLKYDSILGYKTVLCTGTNGVGQLGLGTTVSRSTFAQVTVLNADVQALTLGSAHACAISAGSLFCWGGNNSGQLGVGNVLPYPNPTNVGSSAGIVQIESTRETNCILTNVNTVNCWGQASSNSLGEGGSTARTLFTSLSTVNLGLIGGQTLTGITAGIGHFCATINDGSFKCWGTTQASSQLLNASVSSTAATANTVSGATLVRATGNNTCYLAVAPSKVQCGGPITGFQSLIFDSSVQRIPTLVADTAEIKKIVQTPIMSCRLFVNGRLDCLNLSNQPSFGDGTPIGTIKPTPYILAGQDISDVSLTDFGGCYLKSDNTLWCWGENSQGSVGDGSTTNRLFPVYVMSSVQKIAAGQRHVCLLSTDASLWCFGSNGSGQVGNGTVTNQTRPAKILDGVTDFSIGTNFSCAIKNSKSYCWGANSNGSLGDGSGSQANSPVETVDVFSGNPVKIETGSLHSCALLSDGGAECWGLNASGQLGRGNLSESSIPWKIASSGIVDMSLAANHTCFLMVDTSVRCFGLNSSFQLGNNGTSTINSLASASTPVASGASKLFSGRGNSTCAKVGTQTMCWGQNTGLMQHVAPAAHFPKVILGLMN